MALDRRTLKALTHIHTRHSWDSRMRPAALARQLASADVDLALVTDHDSYGGAIELAHIVDETGQNLRVPIAAEIRTDLGDVIVVFEDGRPPPIEDLKRWDRLAPAVRDLGGLIWLPHPYRSHERVEELAAEADVIEVFNTRCTDEENARALALCARHGKTPSYGSDAHLLRESARCYVQYQPPDPAEAGSSPGSLLDVFRTEPQCLDRYSARMSDIDVAEVINGMKRRRPTLVGYFGLRYARDRVKELL